MSVEVPTLELINASEDRGQRLKPLTILTLQSLYPDTNALHVTSPLNPAPCTTRGPLDGCGSDSAMDPDAT